ncbi:hypothetical protein TeGR_g2749 [Tetraparma gracilis]|uniref:Inositol-phosphate phosphatase n=1 Tax=Tetraparma gracilis TaxID=2962635 RepID=A0ABQ6NA90_9STRA|nr:hypothetical protein TeGR_g2749 [Tetraparma gracilis]
MLEHLSLCSLCSSPGAELEVAYKSADLVDFATGVDLANEKLVSEAILAAFPSHAIIGEESSPDAVHDPAAPTWIIDPIDGTLNFAAGNPCCCVSVAFLPPGSPPAVGVVYAPALGELYVAVSGAGSFLNGRRAAAAENRQPNPSGNPLAAASVAFEFGYAREPASIALMTAALSRLLARGVRALRAPGSGVLNIVWVGLGRLDACYAGVGGEGWRAWDYAAGSLFVEEAGGKVGNWRGGGGGFDLFADNMLCARDEGMYEVVRGVLLE